MGEKYKHYTEKEIEFIRSNYPSCGGIFCAKILQRSYYQIRKIAENLNISYSKEQKNKRLSSGLREKSIDYYKIDPNQFYNITTPEIAYILGLMWADGFVRTRKHHYFVAVGINEEDFSTIEHVFDKTGEWSKYFRKAKYSTWKNMYEIKFLCKHVALYLEKHDYCNKSGASADLILAKIPERLLHYWWRGYFDGDGCIHVSRGVALTFGSVYNQNWKFVVDLFNKLDIKGFRSSNRITDGGNSSYLVCANRDGIIKFGNFIYQGYPDDNIGFNRKYDKYLKVIKKSEFYLNGWSTLKDTDKVLKFVSENNGKYDTKEISKILNLPYYRARYILVKLTNNKKIQSKCHTFGVFKYHINGK